MKIAKDCWVSIDYKLQDGNGNLLDSTEGRDPLVYLQGAGLIIPKLEDALEGKVAGDSVKLVVDPTDAYGDRDQELVQVVSKDYFEDANDVEEGAQFDLQTEDGQIIVTVVKVEGDQITVDGNHPLAGVTLDFEVTVNEVKEATEEEIDEFMHGSCGCGCEDDGEGHTH